MVYGGGDQKLFVSFTKDISVIAHELSHGLVEHTCNLYYYSQPGAANESYADKLGIAIEHWIKGQDNPHKACWFIGDEVVGPEFGGKAIRSFTNDLAYPGENNPRHMNNYYKGLDDNQGVHINSSILNKAFYLYCIKMNEPSYGKPVQIAYKALFKLNPFSSFSAVAKAEYKTAKELYGSNSLEAKAVKEAYKEVGIIL